MRRDRKVKNSNNGIGVGSFNRNNLLVGQHRNN